MSNIESSVTRLLVATKQLIETLTAWSRRQATETDVSDVYVRLGNEFNIARTCFERAGIDMTYLPFPFLHKLPFPKLYFHLFVSFFAALGLLELILIVISRIFLRN